MCLEDQFEMQEIQQLRGQLEEVRALLVSRPGELALAGVQPRLQEIADGLTKMNERVGSSKESLTDENRREIAELLNMATRIGALYSQALHLYSPPVPARTGNG
jgi:hypothetical protein